MAKVGVWYKVSKATRTLREINVLRAKKEEKSFLFINSLTYLSNSLLIIEDSVVNKVNKSPCFSGAFVSERKQGNKIK